MGDAPGSAELTPRALGSGLAVGAILCVANLYTGLKTGFWDSGHVTASVLSFALLSGRLSVLENNTAQTAATAAGAVPAAAGLLGSIPALELLGRRIAAPGIALWGFVLAALGILFAVALRRRLLDEERLPFPTSVATAEVIEVLHSGEAAARDRTRPLLASAAIAAVIGWFRAGRPALVPDSLPFPGSAAGVPLSTFGAGINTSPALAGIGMVVGLRIALSMLLGSAVAWGILAPALVRGPMHLVPDRGAIWGWLAWPGTALLIGAALIALVQQARSFRGALGDLSSVARGRSRLRPWAALVWVAAVIAVIGVGKVVFDLSPALSALSLVALVVGASLCARSAGLTDFAPLGQVGQATQALVGGLAPAQPIANIAAGSVVAGGATQTTVLLWSLGAGARLGGSAKSQIISALAGSALGAVLCAPAYALLIRAYGLGSPALPVPTGVQWKAMGEVVSAGFSALPAGTPLAVALAAAVGLALAALESTRAGSRLPSAFAVGIGVLVPIDYSLVIVAGAVLAHVVRALRPRAAVVGAGLIAGESVIGVIAALLKSFGAL